MCEMLPGYHTVTSNAFDGFASISIRVQSHELYFIEQSRKTLKVGGGHKLTLVDDNKGITEVKKYKLVKAD